MAAELEFAAVPIKITVNGLKHEAVVEPRTLLVYFLREHLSLTGTHVGCDTSQCGACTIQLNGRAVKSCTILAARPAGRRSPLSRSRARRRAHPVQEGFRKNTACSAATARRSMIA
jgi:carbon-monoxide dehydrogenase small subunit